MRLRSLRIQGFRKHYDTKIIFSDSTFLIGENNVGKSSILYALDYLLNNKTKVNNDEYFSYTTSEGIKKTIAKEVVLTAVFSDLPNDARNWRGFKGRILPINDDGVGQTRLSFTYRKTFPVGSNVIIETKEYKKEVKVSFKDCKTVQDYLDNGLEESSLTEDILAIDKNKNLTVKEKKLFDCIDDIYDYNESEQVWVKNPGGIHLRMLLVNCQNIY